MTMIGWFQIALYCAIIVALTPLLGGYMTRVFAGERTLLSPVLRPIERLLYQQSGLLGVSGVSSDMRSLLASPLPAAKEAVDLFVYRIVRELGSLAAALGGLDALVFTAGIGEHAA